MRAAVLRNVGDTTLEVCDDVELIDPEPNDVVVDITHTGVCHSDLSVMNGTIPQTVPLVLGHEGAGIVAEVGDAVTSVSPGDHVIAVWSPPCGTCVYCLRHKSPNLCVDLQFGIMLRRQFRQGDVEVASMCGVGTWAERTLVPEQAVVRIDASIPLDTAALVGCGVMTGVGAALNTAKVAPGSSVVVFGVGGVGVSAIQGARVAGAAEIVAVDLNPAKLAVARSFGATEAVLPDDLDAAKAEVNDGQGFDYALECIGHPATMRAAFDAVRRGGTCCIVGVGRMEEQVSFSAFEFFFAEKNLVGSYYGGADVRVDFHRMLRLAEAGQLDLAGMIDRRLCLEDINDGIEALQTGEVVRQIVEL